MSTVYLDILKYQLVQLCATALSWPAVYMINAMRIPGELLRWVIHHDPEGTSFFPTNYRPSAHSDADPIMACALSNAIVFPILTLLLFAAHAITSRLRYKDDSIHGKKSAVFRLVARDQAAAIIAIMGAFICVLMVVVAVCRFPIDQALGRSLKRVYEWNHVPGTEDMCVPGDWRSCSLYLNTVIYYGKAPDMFLPGFMPAPYFYQVFVKQMAGSLLGLFPFAINYMAGVFMGFLLVLFKRSAAEVKDEAPRAQLTCHEMSCVLWVWNALVMAVLGVVFAIWFAAVPYTPFGEYHPNGYNGPFILSLFDIKKDGKSIIAEDLCWHSGPYEIFLTAFEILLATVLVYWCEFSKVARKMCRADGSYTGFFLPLGCRKHKQHVPLRFFRRFSTYSAQVFYLNDDWIYSLMYRVGQLHISSCANDCTDAGMFYAFLVLPAVTFAVIYVTDFTYGYVSADFILSFISKVSAIIIMAIMMPLMSIPAIKKDSRAFLDKYRSTLKNSFISIFTRPLVRNHTGIAVERFFPEEGADQAGEKEMV